MNAKQFLEKTNLHKIVPVFYHSDLDTTLGTIKAAYEGGVRIFEFVNRGTNGLDTFKSIMASSDLFNDLTIGIGTIYDAATAQSFIDAGAQFVVSPCFVEEVAQLCNAHNIVYLPGIATIKEAHTASLYNCTIVKIFPANVIGSAFAKALKSVLPELHMMPTGGIEPTAASMKPWIDAGVCCIGMGSQLFDKNKIAGKQFKELSKDIAQAIQSLNAL